MTSKKTLLLAGLACALSMFSTPSEAREHEYCREYTKTIRIGGDIHRGYGKACLQPDGSWKIVFLKGVAALRSKIIEDVRKDHHKVVLAHHYPKSYVPVAVYYPHYYRYTKPHPHGHHKHAHKSKHKRHCKHHG